jgi:hypothetical protein
MLLLIVPIGCSTMPLLRLSFSGWARGPFKTYSILKPDQLVARALGVGLLSGDDLSAWLRQTLTDAITHQREHYAGDENDHLSQLRRQTILDWQEGARHAGNARACCLSLPGVA